MTKTALIAIGLIFFACSGAFSAERKGRSTELIKREKGLEDVKKRIREEKGNVKRITAKEVSVLGELERINISLSRKRDELNKVEGELDRTKRSVSAATANISRLEREKRTLLNRLKERMRAMYKLRLYSNVNALLPQWESDSAASGRRGKYMGIIMASDARLMEEAKSAIARLESEKKRLNEANMELERARAETALKKAEAEAVQKERSALLTSIKKEKTASLKLISELDAAAAEMAELIKKLRAQDEATPSSAKGFGAMRGRLPMPADGHITSSYGKVKHQKFQTFTFNNGIVISTRPGAAVKSVYDGKVVYTGWLKGYGQLVILDNGDGFYTLYAHLQKILKERGSEVKKGDEVALAGDTGPDGGAGVYFEIREKGIPRDPVPWFALR